MECYPAGEGQGYGVPGWEGGEGAIEEERLDGVAELSIEGIISLACDIRGGVPVILLLAKRGYVRRNSIPKEFKKMKLGPRYFEKIGKRLEALGLAKYIDGKDPVIVATEAGLPLIRRAAMRIEEELREKGAEAIAERAQWRSPRMVMLDTRMAEALDH